MTSSYNHYNVFFLEIAPFALYFPQLEILATEWQKQAVAQCFECQQIILKNTQIKQTKASINFYFENIEFTHANTGIESLFYHHLVTSTSATVVAGCRRFHQSAVNSKCGGCDWSKLWNLQAVRGAESGNDKGERTSRGRGMKGVGGGGWGLGYKMTYRDW